MFFADHYASNWFDSWNYKWYTGFTITSYPPLVHQIVALLSGFVGLKMAFYLWSLSAMFLITRGVYKFSLLWVDHHSAGIAAIATVFCSSIVEALHIFGQVPSLTGIAFLLNACPEIYKWFRYNYKISFFLSLALLAVTTTAHHVSTIFGMVFFVLPTIGLAVMDKAIVENEKSTTDQIFKWFLHFFLKDLPRAIFYGISVIAITVLTIFPYWYWSKTDPITQVSIPHGSRENFLQEPNLALIFFIIPWGIALLILPFITVKVFRRRSIFLAFSILLAFVLGTGGTTPIPRMILGDTAFEILTLDRFTFWATVMALPFIGLFIKSLLFGQLKDYLTQLTGRFGYGAFRALFLVTMVVINVLIVNLGYFKAFQPEKIDIDPIVNFLETDQHSNWRYLTLGFGDQMAWLSANTDALTVDGNYHSVRRLPELTTRAVERLENAKYQKMEGIGALHDFLTTPEKYHLKYIFSNDKFYEPLLHFRGWNKVIRLENDIVVWEYPDVAPLPKILASKRIPKIQRIMWGILPLSCLILTLLLYFASKFVYKKEDDHVLLSRSQLPNDNIKYWGFHMMWLIILFAAFSWYFLKDFASRGNQGDPEQVILEFYDALDFKRFADVYRLYDPNTRPEKEQFDLERSIEDGILSSFAKLDKIEVNIDYKDSELAIATVNSDWITALDKYNTSQQLELRLKDSKWYVVYKPYERFIPISQFYSVANIDFKNQGRRQANANRTDREDVLDRPEIHVIQACLVKKDSIYSIVGELQNIDNYPSQISIKSILYDEFGKVLSTYNAADVMIHDLLPKEVTSFRIDFPHSEKLSNSIISNFVVFVSSMTTDKSLYKFTGFSDVQIDSLSDQLSFEYLNYGTKEINVPQVLISYYNENNTLYWVESKYHSQGIRPQRSKYIKTKIYNHHRPEIVKTKGRYFTNGVDNSEMNIPNMATDLELWPEKITQSDNLSIRIQLNGFVYDINK